MEQPSKLIGGSYSGLQLYTADNGHWTFNKKLPGFAESSRVMAQDKAGYLWVTHGYKGAYKIHLDTDADSIINVNFYGS